MKQCIKQAIEATPEGEILLPGKWEVFFPDSSIRDCLIDALRDSLIVPVYRLNVPTDYINPTEWTTDLMSLRKVFWVKDSVGVDRQIDGSNPKCIEVAFRRGRCSCSESDPSWSNACSFCKGYP